MNARNNSLAFGFAVLAGLSLAAARPATAQGLSGQSVNLTYLYPTADQVYENDGTQTVTSAGAAFTSAGFVHTLVQPSKIKVTFTNSGTFNSTSFNGIHLSEVGASPFTITGVTVDPATTIAGFDAGRVSFDANNVFANFQGLNFTTNDNITLDVAAAAPAPRRAGGFDDGLARPDACPRPGRAGRRRQAQESEHGGRLVSLSMAHGKRAGGNIAGGPHSFQRHGASETRTSVPPSGKSA